MNKIILFVPMAMFFLTNSSEVKAQTTCPTFANLVNQLSCSVYNPPLECVCTFEIKPAITSTWPIASIEVDGNPAVASGFTLSNTSRLLVKFANNLICSYDEDDYDWCD